MARVLSMKWVDQYIIAAGDIIDVLGIIYQYSLKERIILPIIYPNIKNLFPKDINIEFVQIRDFPHIEEMCQRYGAIRLEADEMFYEGKMVTPVIPSVWLLSGLDFKKREEYYNLSEHAKNYPQLPVPKEPYAFIPEGGSTRSYKCDRKYVGGGLFEVIPPHNCDMLSYANIIFNATEIHCHPTAWHRLIDKLPTKGKLFYHLYARHINIPIEKLEFLQNWEILGENPCIIENGRVVETHEPRIM